MNTEIINRMKEDMQYSNLFLRIKITRRNIAKRRTS